MTRQELLKKIESSPNAIWKETNIEFYAEDNIIYARTPDDKIKYLLMLRAGDNMDDFYGCYVGELKDANILIEFLHNLSVLVGADTHIVGTGIVEKKIVERDIVKEERMSGQIDVYEKLLLSRPLSID